MLVFLVVAITTAVTRGRVRRRSTRPSRASAASRAAQLELAVLLGALAYAGAGGTNNLVVSQLDPRQGLRHGRVRAARGLADHRRGGGRAVGPRLRVPRRREEHGALARVVAQGEHRAVRLVLRDRRDHDRRLLADRLLDGVRQPGRQGQRLRLHPDRGQRAQGRGRRRGSGRCSGSSARSACSARRWGSSTTSRRLVADVLRVGYLRESKRWTESQAVLLVVWS